MLLHCGLKTIDWRDFILAIFLNGNTSLVTNMSMLFQSQELFNEDISEWDVSQVIDMSHMFCEADQFNQPLDTHGT